VVDVRRVREGENEEVGSDNKGKRYKEDDERWG
jgi:ribosome recycling factor